MAVSRAERRAERLGRFEDAFGADTGHDCYGEVTPPPDVVEDIVVGAEGSLGKLITAAWLAVTDHRDLRLLADDIRAGAPE
jgi:hypothetical protein